MKNLLKQQNGNVDRGLRGQKKGHTSDYKHCLELTAS